MLQNSASVLFSCEFSFFFVQIEVLQNADKHVLADYFDHVESFVESSLSKNKQFSFLLLIATLFWQEGVQEQESKVESQWKCLLLRLLLHTLRFSYFNGICHSFVKLGCETCKHQRLVEKPDDSSCNDRQDITQATNVT